MTGRLSDHLRFTNGFARAAGLLPRLAHCFLAKDRAAAQKLAAEHPEFFFLLPDGVSYHGHAVSGGKKTGSGPLALKRELRELTGEVQVKQRAVEGTATALEQLEREIAGFSEDLESLRSCSRARRKTRWRWITSIASWPKSSRGRSRDCRWRGWSWSGLRQEGGRARRTAGARSAVAG